MLAQLYGRCAAAPSKATIWRVVTGADAAAVDVVLGAWLAGQAAARKTTARGPDGDSPELVAIAVDGKTVRGATDTEGNEVPLLATATHRDALVGTQVEIGAKTNEIPMFAPLLDELVKVSVHLISTVNRPGFDVSSGASISGQAGHGASLLTVVERF